MQVGLFIQVSFCFCTKQLFRLVAKCASVPLNVSMKRCSFLNLVRKGKLDKTRNIIRQKVVAGIISKSVEQQYDNFLNMIKQLLQVFLLKEGSKNSIIVASVFMTRAVQDAKVIIISA